MSVYKSEQTEISVGVESSQNTSVTVDTKVGKIADVVELADPEIDWQENRYIGKGRTVSEKVVGEKLYEGGTLPILPVDGFPFAFLLGDDSYDDATDTHTITPREDDIPPSLTLEAAYKARGSISDDFVRTFTGVTADSGTITLDNETGLTVEIDNVAMDVTTGTSLTSVTDSIDDEVIWNWVDASSKLSMFGSDFAKLTSLEIDYENNLQTEKYINDNRTDGGPNEILYGNADIEMTATIKVTDDQIYNEMNSPTDAGFSASIKFAKESGSVTVEFKLKKCNFTSTPVEIPEGADSAEYEAELTAEDIEIIVVDPDSSSAYI